MDLTLGLKAKLIPPLSASLITSRYKWLSLELAEPNLGVPPPIDVNPDSTSDVWILSSDYIGNRGWSSYDPLNFPFSSQERPDLETVGDAVDEVIYKNPDITVFTARDNISSILARNSLLLEPNLITTWSPATLSWGTAKVNPRAITTYYLNVSGSNSTQSQWVTGDWEFTFYLHPGLDQVQPYPGFTVGHNTNYTIFLTAEDWNKARGTGSFNVFYRAPVIVGRTQDPQFTDILAQPVINRNPRLNLNFSVTTPLLNNEFYFIAWPQAFPTLTSTTARPVGTTTGFTSRGIRRGPIDVLFPDAPSAIPYFIEVSENPQNSQLILTFTS